MSEHVIVGPCLTRRQAADRAGISPDDAKHRPDLLRLRGCWLEETYFAFQFDEGGIRPDVGRAVMELRAQYSGRDLADFLVRPNGLLDNATPLGWLKTGHTLDDVIAAASQH